VPPTDPDAWRRAGERVVNYRRAHSVKKHGRRQPLTQEALAARAGVSPGCLQAFENNTRATQLENVQRIAAAVGLSLEALFAAPESAAAQLERAQAIFADELFGRGTNADGPLSIEAVAVARLWEVAWTPVRLAIFQQLVAHATGRKDRAAVAILEALELAGLIALPPTPSTGAPEAVALPSRRKGGR
jgi:transcriptional regulator with XRE-family HTH domain